MTLLHILHARLDLDDGTELVHHYYQGNPAAEKINGVLQLAFLPKQQQVNRVVKHVFRSMGFICVGVSVTVESENVRGFEQTSVILLFEEELALPNAFNLGAELLDTFVQAQDEFGHCSLSPTTEADIERLVGAQMQNFSYLQIGDRRLRFSAASNLDALPGELYPLLSQIFQKMLQRKAKILVFENQRETHFVSILVYACAFSLSELKQIYYEPFLDPLDSDFDAKVRQLNASQKCCLVGSCNVYVQNQLKNFETFSRLTDFNDKCDPRTAVQRIADTLAGLKLIRMGEEKLATDFLKSAYGPKWKRKLKTIEVDPYEPGNHQ